MSRKSKVSSNLDIDFNRKQSIEYSVVGRLNKELRIKNKILNSYYRKPDLYENEIKDMKLKIRELKRMISEVKEVMISDTKDKEFIINLDINDCDDNEISQIMNILKDRDGYFEYEIKESFMGRNIKVAYIYDKGTSRFYGCQKSIDTLDDILRSGTKLIVYMYENKKRKLANHIRNMCSSRGARILAWGRGLQDKGNIC